MRRRPLFRTSAVLAGLALGASLLQVPATAQVAAERPEVGPSTPGAVLSSQSLSLGSADRLPGMPASDKAHQQLAAISIERKLYDDHDWVTVRPTLAAAPRSDDERVYVFVGLGHRVDNTCQLQAQRATRTTVGERTSEYLYYLGESDYNARMGSRPDTPYTCGVAWVEPADSSAQLDGLIGAPTNAYAAPRLAFGKVTLLGANQKKLRLVKGVWTPYSVTVRNTGTLPVTGLTLTGSGKKVKVRRASSSVTVAPGKTATLSLQVRHGGRKKKATVRLAVSAPQGVKATRTIRVVRTKAPKKAANGRYVGAGGRVKFRIRNGRVTGFSATTTTRCEASNDAQSTYNFPRVKVPRHGVVVASRKGSASGSRWTSSLQMRAVGKKVTRGHFGYHFYTPGVPGSSCSATESFKARRVGK